MTRLALVFTLAFFAAPLATEAQPAAKVYRIGLLASRPPTAPEARVWEGFFQGLRELGYVEGKNLVIEGRFRRGGPSDSRPSRPSWFASRSTSSSPAVR